MNEIASSSTSTPPAAQPAPLRPCPFCGEAPEIEQDNGNPMAFCDNPDCRFEEPLLFPDWNRRAPDPSRAALVAALEERNEALEAQETNWKSREAWREKAEELKERLGTLRDLLGYVELGEGQTVTLFQDDATKTFHIKAGEQGFYADSFFGVLDAARQALALADAAGKEKNI